MFAMQNIAFLAVCFCSEKPINMFSPS